MCVGKMSERFSATLRVGDLNDYIAPSQGCVVSLKSGSSRLNKIEKPSKVVNATKIIDTDPVKISLKDCLACSGCITSAETVMLEKQSTDEFLSNISKGKAVIVSLSPQSRASLAVHYNLSPIQVFRKLTTFFKSLGVIAVYDTSCSRDLTLMESCEEFVSRYKQSHSFDDEKSKLSLPIISSSCPGWICYAEKSLGEVLPHVSAVKSPQQTMGAIIKRRICQNLCLRPEELYHVTVMPCYDKKLEASRDDFVFQAELEDNKIMITEVDSVLTTGEVLDLLQLKSVDFRNLEESSLDNLLTNVTEEGDLFGVLGSSGGYAETIFRYAAKTLFGQDIKGPLDFKIIRNSDFREVSLKVEGKTVLKFALCYGFRNIQSIKRRIKGGKCDYQYFEIMACPSGCLNGGGQIKPKTGQSAKDLIKTLESTYMENMLVADPYENSIATSLYKEWLEQPGSERAKKYIHTQYRPVAKSITSELRDW